MTQRFAIFSTTINPLYDFFVPIVSRVWELAGIQPVCYIPDQKSPIIDLIESYSHALFPRFSATAEQLPTYSQNVRIYCGTLQVPDDSILILTDVDMIICNTEYFRTIDSNINILGADLTPDNQFPVCYTSMSRKLWNELFECGDSTHQEMLDKNLGHIDCDNMRGNYWCHEQEKLRTILAPQSHITIHNRAFPGTQFASRRIDRTDTNWEAYLQPETIDCHAWREGYTEENFERIMIVLQIFHRNENWAWVEEYRQKYLSILNTLS